MGVPLTAFILMVPLDALGYVVLGFLTGAALAGLLPLRLSRWLLT